MPSILHAGLDENPDLMIAPSATVGFPQEIARANPGSMQCLRRNIDAGERSGSPVNQAN
jgi:hypothetical protein